MGYAEATLGATGRRIFVRTHKTPGVDDFQFMLAACKAVNGGQYHDDPAIGKLWSYPLSVTTCTALRQAFGPRLRVGNDLAAWYRTAAANAAAQQGTAQAHDAELSTRVPARFARWLRGYQRVGALWIAQGYRGAGLVADKPGVGKTAETLAALLEADVQGPVLVVCPKASVRSVWGREARTHLRGVPVYLCQGTREKRERVLQRFAQHMAKNPARLRIVVVVAEMLRVELGNPCYTNGGNKVSGMCPQKRNGVGRRPECDLHIDDPAKLEELFGIHKDEKKIKKDLVPVGFSYPELYDVKMLGGGWSWVILDESHKLLGSLSVVQGNLMGRALRLLPERSGARRYALSGTPFGKGGRVEGMFGTLHWLWPDEYTSFWKWARAVFDIEDKVINRFGKTVSKIIGIKGMTASSTAAEENEAWEAFLRSLGPRVLRRTKEEVMKELPPKTYVEVICEMAPGQQKQYQELVDYAEVRTSGGIVAANGTLPLRTRSQQLANGQITKGKDGKVQFTGESGKLDRLWDNLDARGILDGLPGDKLVIASRYNEFLDVIEKMLEKEKVPLLRLDGGTSDKRREYIMNRWQEGVGEERVLLLNVHAGGVSITLDAADEMHIMDEDSDPGVNEQLEDRIHRASRVHKVFIYYYRTEGSVDLAAAHDVEYRRRLQHAVMDGRRGVEDLRQVLADALEEGF